MADPFFFSIFWTGWDQHQQNSREGPRGSGRPAHHPVADEGVRARREQGQGHRLRARDHAAVKKNSQVEM